MAETPSVSNGAQHCENERKNSVLNYESPALTAELQAHRAMTGEHPNIQAPTSNFQGRTEISDCESHIADLGWSGAPHTSERYWIGASQRADSGNTLRELSRRLYRRERLLRRCGVLCTHGPRADDQGKPGVDRPTS